MCIGPDGLDSGIAQTSASRPERPKRSLSSSHRGPFQRPNLVQTWPQSVHDERLFAEEYLEEDGPQGEHHKKVEYPGRASFVGRQHGIARTFELIHDEIVDRLWWWRWRRELRFRDEETFEERPWGLELVHCSRGFWSLRDGNVIEETIVLEDETLAVGRFIFGGWSSEVLFEPSLEPKDRTVQINLFRSMVSVFSFIDLFKILVTAILYPIFVQILEVILWKSITNFLYDCCWLFFYDWTDLEPSYFFTHCWHITDIYLLAFDHLLSLTAFLSIEQ